MRAEHAALITAALAAVFLWPRSARASESIIDRSSIDDDLSDAVEIDAPFTEGYSVPSLDLSGIFDSIDWLEGGEVQTNDPVGAFLYMIRSTEHRASDVASGADYGTFFGGGRFTNFADHPVITGELRGVPLKPEWCRAAGYPSGRCVSTAAGAYQFTRPTWEQFRARGAWGPRLPDFSPASQDEAARRILGTLGVPAMLAQGDLQRAIAAAAPRWASLPGSTSGQPQKSMAFAIAKFNEGATKGWQA